jgi:hypothetical protein
MSEARINRITNEQGTGGPVISGITTFSGLNYFVPPRGTTAERPSNCPSGSIRFNTDSAHLEYFDGLQWLEFEAFNNELGVNGALGTRGVFGGGYIKSPTSVNTNTIDYITISTTGNAIDFGDLTNARRGSSSTFASSTRGCFSNGFSTAAENRIDYITISSTGNAATFGNTLTAFYSATGLANSTRGIIAGGVPSSNVIQYATIASTGNTVDFGDTSFAGGYKSACASSTRGIIAGGTSSNVIDFIIISTLGNSSDFGDLTQARGALAGGSNSTRGIFGGGTTPTLSNVIDYITISTTGNAIDFGDLLSVYSFPSFCASSTRGVWSGGYSPTPGTAVNVIQYATIASTGNTVDFGDMSTAAGLAQGGACSNGHGGL